ncbi:unnamed protein product [Leptidea sinapis]|uniref:Uncharacterized protein n=1 Tax=Leptidea sinapis TaxID=189913 RepID=A0A5E4QA46_9NEOP|nr:unnamed protein product [Leptidea sinapis]
MEDSTMRPVSQENLLSEEVQRKQSEYQKCLESYKQMRAKFEENYLKCEYELASHAIIDYYIMLIGFL